MGKKSKKKSRGNRSGAVVGAGASPRAEPSAPAAKARAGDRGKSAGSPATPKAKKTVTAAAAQDDYPPSRSPRSVAAAAAVAAALEPERPPETEAFRTAAPTPAMSPPQEAGARERLGRLDADISALRSDISGMGPTIHPHPERFGLPPDCELIHREKLDAQSELGDKLEEREGLAEEVRVACVVRVWRETTGPESDPYETDPDDHDRECPLCLEPWPLYEPGGLRYHGRRRLCCGKRTCGGCQREQRMAGVRRAAEGGVAAFPQLLKENMKCHYCRADIPWSCTPEEEEREIRRHAEAGKTWAQSELGRRYLAGDGGFPLDRKMAAFWYKRAADKGNCPARFYLGTMYEEGLGGLPQSDAEARKLYLLAAEIGLSAAQFYLARLLLSPRRRRGGPSAEAAADGVRWLTLSAAHGAPKAQCMLGRGYRDGDWGLERSALRALHWFRKAAVQDDAEAQLQVAGLLVSTRKGRSDDGFPVHLHTGYSVVPEALHWARRAAAGGADEADETAGLLERMCLDACGGCQLTAEECGRPLRRCVRCKAAAYCGVDCQKSHWTEGHKNDCYQGAD